MEYTSCEQYILNQYLTLQKIVNHAAEVLTPVVYDLNDIVNVLMVDKKIKNSQKVEAVNNAVTNLRPILTELLELFNQVKN